LTLPKNADCFSTFQVFELFHICNEICLSKHEIKKEYYQAKYPKVFLGPHHFLAHDASTANEKSRLTKSPHDGRRKNKLMNGQASTLLLRSVLTKNRRVESKCHNKKQITGAKPKEGRKEKR